MFETLKSKIHERFPEQKSYQMCYLYDVIMKHFGVNGIEREELGSVMIRHLHHEGFLREDRTFLNVPDMFEMTSEEPKYLPRSVGMENNLE